MRNGNAAGRELLVMKFGGTSVANAQCLKLMRQAVSDASQTEAAGMIVVVSALQGVTDSLRGAVSAAAENEQRAWERVLEGLRARHENAAAGLPAAQRLKVLNRLDHLLGECRVRLARIAAQGRPDKRSLDAVMPLGELMSSAIAAAYLREEGHAAQPVDGAEVIVTDGGFQRARPLIGPTTAAARARLMPILARGGLPVVAGYTGATRTGARTTLGRGGSDLTATLLGACLAADQVWIWTDVEGVMSADPRALPGVHYLSELDREEAAQLARFGAKVLHPSALQPLIGTRIPVRIRSTFRQAHRGTIIRPDPAGTVPAIKAVTAIRSAAMLSVIYPSGNRPPGNFASLAAWLRRAPVIAASSGTSPVWSLDFLLPQDELEACSRQLEVWASTESPTDHPEIKCQADISVVTAIGAGIGSDSGVQQTINRHLLEHGIRKLRPLQSYAGCSLSAVVAEPDLQPTLAAIHRLVSPNGSSVDVSPLSEAATGTFFKEAAR